MSGGLVSVIIDDECTYLTFHAFCVDCIHRKHVTDVITHMVKHVQSWQHYQKQISKINIYQCNKYSRPAIKNLMSRRVIKSEDKLKNIHIG